MTVALFLKILVFLIHGHLIYIFSWLWCQLFLFISWLCVNNSVSNSAAVRSKIFRYLCLAVVTNVEIMELHCWSQTIFFRKCDWSHFWTIFARIFNTQNFQVFKALARKNAWESCRANLISFKFQKLKWREIILSEKVFNKKVSVIFSESIRNVKSHQIFKRNLF